MDLKVEALTTLATAEGIADEWRELHDSSRDVNPFSGPDWALTWLKHFAVEGQREALVLAVRDGDRLVGVAPLYRHRMLRGIATIVQPIGTGDPWIGPYELPSIAAAAGLGRDVARAIVEFLCERSGAWDWANILLGSAAPWFEPEWLPDWKFTISVRNVRAAVILDLSGGTNIYAGRRNLKESFRRARNRLTRDFGPDGWSVRRVVGAADVAAAFDRLSDLHGERADLQNGQPIHANVVADAGVRAFLREVVVRLSARGRASVYELLVGDEVKACQLVFHTETASYSSISGAAEQIWPYSAVTYLQSQIVSDAQAVGHERLCLSLGPNQAKLRWTDTVETYTEFGLVGPRLRSRLLYLGAETRDLIASYRSARNAHRV